MHVHVRERTEDVRCIYQTGPIELDVLSRCEMAVAPIPTVSDVCQHAHLITRERSVGNRDPQHVGMKLQINPIHESERFELILCQGTRQTTIQLLSKLLYTIAYKSPIKLRVCVH